MMKLILAGGSAVLGVVALAALSGALVLPPGTDSDCAGEVPIVVASDEAAQSDLYSAATLAGVLDTTCIVLAGARDEPMPADQLVRLEAADAEGWMVGGTAAVSIEKVAGRRLKRLDGVDRWHTARLAGAVAADPDGDVAALTTATAPVAGAARGTSVMVDGAEVLLPPGIDSDCAGQVPIVVAVDAAAQADLYSAATLAGVLDTTCIVLAGPRGEAMTLAQRGRLFAAKGDGWIVGGEASVPPAKTAGYHLARQGGTDRWHTARLVGAVAADQAANPTAGDDTDNARDGSATNRSARFGRGTSRVGGASGVSRSVSSGSRVVGVSAPTGHPTSGTPPALGWGTMPGLGKTIIMARANWSTGYFQAEVYRTLLTELGYMVTDPAQIELAPQNAYVAMARGDFDFWANSWYPGHLSWLDGALTDGSQVREHVSVVGAQMVAGGLQGMLIEKGFADEFNIRTIDDLNDNPAAIAAYDEVDSEPGNGKADILGCPESWTCDDILESTILFAGWQNIAQTKAGYDAMFAQAVNKAADGEPFIIYTWTPSTYITQLQPGVNVYWVGIENTLDDSNPLGAAGGHEWDQRPGRAPIPPAQCPSAQDDPTGLCKIGWVAADIRVTANKEFLAANPAAAELLKQVKLSVLDVSLANVEQGEGAEPAALATAWIADNRVLVNGWLNRARASVFGSLLDTVMSRGVLNCGVSGAAVGFSETQPDGDQVGFDADYCRVVAAAILGDATAVEFTALTAAERFTAVQTGAVDLLMRNSTWTQSRDSEIGMDFGPTTYYDGQQLMGRASDGYTASSEVTDVAGAVVCTNAGTTAERNIADATAAAGVAITLITFEDFNVVTENFVSGACDVITTDGLWLVGRKAANEPDGETWVIFPATPITTEPLGPVYRQNDSAFADVVNWAVYATIIADEYGITSRNVHRWATNRDAPAEVQRLLGGEGEKQTALGLNADAFWQVIAQVGNYDEIYSRNLVPVGLTRGGSPNARWTEGGLIYAPPAR